MGSYSRAEPLGSGHDVEAFDRGTPELDEFLARYALQNQRADGTRTFVVTGGEAVVGYYSLVAASVQQEDAPPRVRQGLASGREVGVVLLARLAVAVSEQGKGLGQALIKDALVRVARISEDVGIRAVLVHAKDETARRFYEHLNFEPSPTDPLHLFLLMKDLRAWIRETEAR